MITSKVGCAMKKRQMMNDGKGNRSKNFHDDIRTRRRKFPSPAAILVLHHGWLVATVLN